MRFPWLALLAACTGETGSSSGPPHVVTTPQTTVPDTLELNGERPEENLAAPVFSQVTNRDGSPRAQADLVGHPTVMWFYPAAGTGG